MSYERMEKRAAELEAEVARWLSSAAAADAGEDKLSELRSMALEARPAVA